MALTHKDVQSILELIERMGYDEIRLELEDLKIEVRRTAQPTTAPRLETPLRPAAPAPAAAATNPESGRPALQSPTKGAPARPRPAGDSIPEGCVPIRSPSVGTFYRAPSPEQPPFVEVGSVVSREDSVGLVEVMKLFHSVHPEMPGTIVEIRVDNGALVEFGQVLMVLRPDDETSVD